MENLPGSVSIADNQIEIRTTTENYRIIVDFLKVNNYTYESFSSGMQPNIVLRVLGLSPAHAFELGTQLQLHLSEGAKLLKA